MTTLTYRGYTAKVEVDLDDEILVGRILGINDVVGFHADNPKELKAAFEEAVEDYLVTCERAGKEPEKSYSGKMMFRVDPAIHRQAAIAAEAADQSLNEWGECALLLALGTKLDASHHVCPAGTEKRLDAGSEKLMEAIFGTKDRSRKLWEAAPSAPLQAWSTCDLPFVYRSIMKTGQS